ncbi:MAG: hypothetical protein QXK76_03550 [Candidatus Woesearchaeota archaeon]
MLKIKAFFIIIIVSVTVLLSGCSKVYVCYDGTQQKIASKCPTIPRATITEQEAGRAIDNFGNAVAQAKGFTYTRVNLYQQNATWYAGVLFTNKQTQSITQTIFRIDGKTGSVSCYSGCEDININ